MKNRDEVLAMIRRIKKANDFIKEVDIVKKDRPEYTDGFIDCHVWMVDEMLTELSNIIAKEEDDF